MESVDVAKMTRLSTATQLARSAYYAARRWRQDVRDYLKIMWEQHAPTCVARSIIQPFIQGIKR